MAVGVIALVPTPVALLVTLIGHGKKGPVKLIRYSFAWQLNPKWYALAILVPVTIHLLAAAGALLTGARLAPQVGALMAYLPLTLVLAVGEEIGWQGFALPRMRAIFSPLLTAVIFGTLHALFHLPMYLLPLPPELRQASPFSLFLLMAMAFALYRVWFHEHTGGNVLQIIVYHAAINTSVLIVAGVDSAVLGWLLPLAWVLGALPLLAVPRFQVGRIRRNTQISKRSGECNV